MEECEDERVAERMTNLAIREQTSRDVKRARDAAAGCARPEATAVPDRAGRAVWLEKVQAIRGRQESDRDSSASADREAVSSWIPLPKRQARQRP